MKNIRNFSIIAHIDHGKTTLSDRLIELCNGLSKYEMKSQVLDTMELEKERGITIKAQSVTLYYQLNNKNYTLNFIDTPGHVDFSYEVSRSLAACEGAILLIDAGQGIEAQTLSNYNIAIKMGLTVIPVINKIDLLTVNINKIEMEIEEIIGNITQPPYLKCSAKTGLGVKNILYEIINNIPYPSGNILSPVQALIIDSWFDNYLGVIALICMKNGIISQNDKIIIMNTNKIYYAEQLGIFTPKKIALKQLCCGDVGWIVLGIKNILEVPIGGTITLFLQRSLHILPGFKKSTPKVFAGLFPIITDDYKVFSNALMKLSLNDASLTFEPENSEILGFGYRCGFLGLLHMEIIQERLLREYNIEIIITTPTVKYRITTINKEVIYENNPAKFPPLHYIKHIKEPIVECKIFTPIKYIGKIIKLCISKHGIQINIVYHTKHVMLIYEIPMAEVIINFFDQLKSITKGYASLDYYFIKFKITNIICVNILINKKRIDSLTTIIYKEKINYFSHILINTIKNLIPRQQFDITIQAAVGTKIIASTYIKQLRKNVIAKCYGGDISRKKKLIQKQKIGKKRMKNIGNILLPSSIFLAVLNIKK
ncbi:translation elongation factor 4 [Enterobacteriaceae endosymbiont of Macroplea appendiculata]|uniref:translation elongation factor 4 n=1 Tax=Enterobacteriaceae endosymbiont of Macroplea appendiculata TaxID=2675790 RepID=UPI0014495606|nr:translation elongation factor 4 [Enterobacteriaceae endosymbiont of Macroplea appendiculata]QJC30792.1 elongation factor 4 [Enterobacteriaceae endosymbiont of Macroplea appendiculata]